VKQIFTAAILMLTLMPGLSFCMISVSNIQIDSIRSEEKSYGNIWKGFLKYDVAADSAKVWVWLELSTDGGETWSQTTINQTGAVGTVSTGTGKKVWWMVDGNKGENCKIRIRVNDQPKRYYLTYTSEFLNNVVQSSYIDTVTDSLFEAPKTMHNQPIFDVLEMMVNADTLAQGMDLTNTGIYGYIPPYYTRRKAGAPEITVNKGEQSDNETAIVGFGRAGRMGSTLSNDSTATMYLRYRATYFKVGDEEFVMINKNSIRGCLDSVTLAKNAVAAALGIPAENILYSWEHSHYTDNGNAGADSCVAAALRAKNAALPALMAYKRIPVGLGYNYRRIGASHGLTNGPVDDNLYVVLFRDTIGNHLGSWIRFAGHDGSQNGQVQRDIENRLGGTCFYFQGGAGTSVTWTSYEADINKLPETHTWRYNIPGDKLMNELSSMTYKPILSMSVSSMWDYIYPIATTQVQAFRINDFFIGVFTGENSMEQTFYTDARLNNIDNTMIIGYSNSGCGIYHDWSNGSSAKRPTGEPAKFTGNNEAWLNAEFLIRSINILSNQ
jgi:hypothetical protein